MLNKAFESNQNNLTLFMANYLLELNNTNINDHQRERIKNLEMTNDALQIYASQLEKKIHALERRQRQLTGMVPVLNGMPSNSLNAKMQAVAEQSKSSFPVRIATIASRPVVTNNIDLSESSDDEICDESKSGPAASQAMTKQPHASAIQNKFSEIQSNDGIESQNFGDFIMEDMVTLFPVSSFSGNHFNQSKQLSKQDDLNAIIREAVEGSSGSYNCLEIVEQSEISIKPFYNVEQQDPNASMECNGASSNMQQIVDPVEKNLIMMQDIQNNQVNSNSLNLKSRNYKGVSQELAKLLTGTSSRKDSASNNSSDFEPDYEES